MSTIKPDFGLVKFCYVISGYAVVRFDGPVRYTYKASLGTSIDKTYYDIDVKFLEVFD